MTSQPTKFGAQVRTRRLAAGLTQAELAESAGISERTISDLERGLRSTIYPATARRLATALGISGDHLATFLAEARSGTGAATTESEPAMIPSDRRAQLPVPLTRLLGRESEVASVLELLRRRHVRLVTLVGPGGIGKTRLAIEVAANAAMEYTGGTYFVSVSDADDPDMVLPLMASAVGLPPAAGDVHLILAQRFSQHATLVVLDTLERMVDAAPAIAQLLETCPDLSILATSRTPLRLRGEHEVPVLPLRLNSSESQPSALAPASELFLERAAAVAPGFEATAGELELVADICARVDGVPLAIELAAAQVKHMPLTELLRQLDHRLEPLVGGARDLPARQRTMRRTHDWSYALLGADAMRLFRCLSVFRGSFGRDAAEALDQSLERPDAAEFMLTLTALVDSSLVLPESGVTKEARYRLLDVTREYAVERSVASGEFDALRRRHADFFLARAERAEPELRGKDQQLWHARLMEDEGNFRAALTWALEVGQGEIALRLAGALWMFWRWAGLFAEGRGWLEAALAVSGECALELRCQAFWGAGWLAFHAGDYQRTDELGQEMLRLLAGRDDDLLRRNALTLVGNAALADGRNDDAIAAYGHALAMCAKPGPSWYSATSLLNLGAANLQSHRLTEARELFEQALAIYEGLGDQHFTARLRIQLGYVALLSGESAAAAAQIERAMEIVAGLKDGWAIAEGLEAIATLRGERDPQLAAELGGAAERLRERIAMRAHPPDDRINRAYLERARQKMGSQTFEGAWREGRGMTLQTAIGLALSRAVGSRPGGV